jgi:squalene cyclase
MRTLRWFKKEQSKNGSWHSRKDPKAVATGLAVLCFLGHGETPASEEFGETVEKALLFLLSIQDENGRFDGANENPAIEHGIIAMALCEAYGMTKNPMCMEAATKAVNVILEAQLPV